MRLLVTGDRMWGRAGDNPSPLDVRRAKMEREQLELVLDMIHESPGVTCMIVGDAKGADEFAKRWAISRAIPFAENEDGKKAPFVADWDSYPKAAGPIRNQAMLAKGNPDACVAFHRDFIRSKGTKDMVDRCLKAGIMVIIHPTAAMERA